MSSKIKQSVQIRCFSLQQLMSIKLRKSKLNRYTVLITAFIKYHKTIVSRILQVTIIIMLFQDNKKKIYQYNIL